MELLRDLREQARSDVLLYMHCVCKTVDVHKTYAFLKVITSVYKKQQQLGKSDTCYVNVPGFTEYQLENARYTGPWCIEDCLKGVLGDRLSAVDVHDALDGSHPNMHGWYFLKGEGELLHVFFRKASALPDLRKWCFSSRATEPKVSLWAGNLRGETTGDIQNSFDTLYPTMQLAAKMQGMSFTGSSQFVRCSCLQDVLYLKGHPEQGSTVLTSYGPKMRFGPWQLQLASVGHDGSRKKTPGDVKQKQARGYDNGENEKTPRIGVQIRVLLHQNQLLGGRLPEMDDEFCRLRLRTMVVGGNKKMDPSAAVAAIKEIEALGYENRRLSTSEVVLMQKME